MGLQTRTALQIQLVRVAASVAYTARGTDLLRQAAKDLHTTQVMQAHTVQMWALNYMPCSS